jgi:hypothetical protein
MDVSKVMSLFIAYFEMLVRFYQSTRRNIQEYFDIKN